MIEVVGMLVVAQEHGIGSTEGLGGERRGAHFVSVVCANWYWPGGSKVGSVRTRKPQTSRRAVGPPMSVIPNAAWGASLACPPRAKRASSQPGAFNRDDDRVTICAQVAGATPRQARISPRSWRAFGRAS